jgi:glycosyltransferase Alg8
MTRRRNHRLAAWGKVLLLAGVLVLLVLRLPNDIWDPVNSIFVITFGLISIWRYLWWTTHFVRSRIYRLLVFPKQREKAERLWNSGWRPSFLHFMVVTFRERRETTERMLASIVEECRRTSIAGRIYVGTGDPSDEQHIEEFFATHAPDVDIDTVIVRQNQSGKRFAIGAVLRAINRHGVGKNDLAVFMDGDTIIEAGLIEKCAPLFATKPKLGALTTDEHAVVAGPGWMQAWHDLRFAQRRLAMESHSLSHKVLTLTGRLSLFRAEIAVNEDFIRTVEADSLTHWLWGQFRFMSGDDKSTWFWVLRDGWEMMYVPDASCDTIENIETKPWERLKHNLLRWSGNLLRNGARAIVLGPKRVGPFIWWCLIDQRLSMWTMLSGPVAALILAIGHGPQILLAYLVWVICTRLMLSCVLFYYAEDVYLAFPFLLYVNQVVIAIVKVHLLFRLSKQRWLNRGDQKARLDSGNLLSFQKFMASFLTAFYIGLAVFVIAIYSGAVRLPQLHTLAWIWTR